MEIPNIIAIITSRINSTRLPHKAMRLIEGKPMIQRVYERTKHSKLLDDVVIATTKRSKPIIQWAKRKEISYYIGSEEDILGRLYHAARLNNADIVVRIWGDAPLGDSEIIDKVIQAYLDNNMNYVYTQGFPAGTDVSVISFGSLRKLQKMLKDPEQRHWIHKTLISSPQVYRCGAFQNKPDMSWLDWSVDTQFDLEFARLVYKTLGDNFHWKDVLALLCKNK